jgi:hypothetical protein
MNTGKTLFAQIMDFLPWKTFHRIVARHGGDKGVRSLTCAEQFRAMAFAQLTYRESLRDIEACLLAQAAKLYHMGFREPLARSTLADANESRDWRIWEAFAGRLIIQARELYLSEDLGLDLSNTVYALDSTTIDLCHAADTSITLSHCVLHHSGRKMAPHRVRRLAHSLKRDIGPAATNRRDDSPMSMTSPRATLKLGHHAPLSNRSSAVPCPLCHNEAPVFLRRDLRHPGRLLRSYPVGFTPLAQTQTPLDKACC